MSTSRSCTAIASIKGISSSAPAKRKSHALSLKPNEFIALGDEFVDDVFIDLGEMGDSSTTNRGLHITAQ
jgi:hypothetical protein